MNSSLPFVRHFFEPLKHLTQKIMQRVFVIGLLFLFKTSFGQTDLKKEMKIFSFVSPKYGKVEFCTFISTIEKKKPLLIFIHGSGNHPTFEYHKDLKS